MHVVGIFRFNPGLQQKTFPDYNPYTISQCRNCAVAKGNDPSGPLSLSRPSIPLTDLCQGCKLVRQCEALRFNVIKEFDNGGKVSVHQLVNSEDSDYGKLMEVATFFAKTFGEDVKLTPKMSRPPQFAYQNIYSTLMGTVYEGKCPDLLVGSKWYEHEGFETDNAKRAFSNMMNHGLKQSSRLIIDKPELTDRYMLRSIMNRVLHGQHIDEVWLRNNNEEVKLLYKTTDG